MKVIPLLVSLLILSAGCVSPAGVINETGPLSESTQAVIIPGSEDRYVFEQNQRLGRGINLGNALEAPLEGEWGVVLKENYFATIKEGGFDSIRVPIRWSAHAPEGAPFTISPDFFARIDWVVEQAIQNDLMVIINMHHYEEIMVDPQGHRERFLSMWRQIADHFKDAPESVYFELLNEPNGAIARGGTWNEIAADGIREIRKTNPDRTLIVGPGNWNAISSLQRLTLPEDDRNLIVTVHYYEPFHFTHQGAEWVDGSDSWLGTLWKGSPGEASAVRSALDRAERWGQQNNRPIFLGEFGAYSKADMDSRARYTAFVAREADQRGFSWAYWEFGAGFGAYDREKEQWIEKIYRALVP